jgi:Putative Zn-dependent protease, contains TPR repeats
MPDTRPLFDAASVLHAQGRLQEAETRYRAIVQDDPSHGGAWHRLGLICIQTGRIGEAETALRCAAQSAPDDAAIRQHLGLLLLKTGRAENAIEEATAAVTLQPQFGDGWNTLGAAHLALGDPAKAMAALTQALRFLPDDPECWKNIGQCELARDNPADALLAFGKALSRSPQMTAAKLGRIEALCALDRQDDALALAQNAIADEPDCAPLHMAEGTALKQLGRFADAETAFATAVRLAPDMASFHRALGETRPYRDRDDRLVALEQLAARQQSLGPVQQIELHFALFKAYDDLGRHQEAFRHLEQANRLYRERLPYDEAGVMAFFDDVRRAFSASAVEAVSQNPSELCIFIAGMPRSGTSLVEQILASHPDVFGAGEKTFLGKTIAALAPSYPQNVTTSDAEAIGRRYEEMLRSLKPDAMRITDKLPANFRHLGLIHKALPKARIIHVMRDGADTCFSCYTKLFRSGLNFAYNQGELGRYFNAYQALMQHWRQILPPDCFYEIRYEALVGDLEGKTRRLLEFCGLSWDPACLRFYQADRAVRTLSEFQVRKPVYSSAIGRWRPYAPWLGELLQILAG